MKTAAISALIVVVALIAFAGGSFSGYGGMLIALMMGYVLVVVLPIATAVVAILAAIFAISARASNAKPNWKFFFKLAAGAYGVAILVAIGIATHAIQTGF